MTVLYNQGFHYIELKNYILKYKTNVDKLFTVREEDFFNKTFLRNSMKTSLDKAYKHEIVRQMFGGGNA